MSEVSYSCVYEGRFMMVQVHDHSESFRMNSKLSDSFHVCLILLPIINRKNPEGKRVVDNFEGVGYFLIIFGAECSVIFVDL